LLRGVPLKRELLFAAFGGEEQGLFGSVHCAEVAAAERWPIELVVNMDMVGFPNGFLSIVLSSNSIKAIAIRRTTPCPRRLDC
jgi:Zn-dependent M28 family amino/carboxypeptidase